MLKSYYCITYNFKTKDDGRIIFLRVILHTEHTNIHKCNSKFIIAITNVYDFINYDLNYLSSTHLDKCSSEDKINRYGRYFVLKSTPIKMAIQHSSLDSKTLHPHFNFIEDTFNTLEEYEIVGNTTKITLTDMMAIEISQKFAFERTTYPIIDLNNIQGH